jgi:Uncharacterized protein conserved in bacteria
MRYQNPEVRELLAGEYVLGTLQGGARRRFERLLQEDAALKLLVAQWECLFNPLVESLLPVTPPARVLKSIARRITPPKKPRLNLWDHLGFWRTVGMMASAVSLMLISYIGAMLSPAPSLGYITVLNDPQVKPLWLVSLDVVSKKIIIQAVHPPHLAEGKSWELWLLPGKEQPPYSLGLLPPSGARIVTLPKAGAVLVPRASGLAVSLEPAGGSPTGAPTGPVLYQGALLTL